MKYLLTFIAIAFLFISCKKENPPFIPDEGDDIVIVPKSWTLQKSDPAWYFTDIKIIGDRIYVQGNIPSSGGFAFKTLVFLSEDKGHNWTCLSYDDDQYYSGIEFVDEYNGMMAGFRSIARTSDGGQTWDTTSLGLTNFESFYKVSSKKIFACGTSVHVSNDTGATWTTVLPNNNLFTTMDFVSKTVGFTGNYNGEFYKTTDGGNSWNLVNTLFNNDFYRIDFINDSVGIAMTGFVTTPSSAPEPKLLSTTDGGITWNLINVQSFGLTLERTSPCVLNSRNQIWLGTSNGLYFSRDFGESWILRADGFGFVDIQFSEEIGIATTRSGNILNYE